MTPPLRLTPRHHLLAFGVLRGKSDAEIAAESGYSISRLSVIKSSPLFRALVENLRKELKETTVGNLAGRLASMGDKALTTLDDAMDLLPSEPAVAVSAARDVLDRVPQTARVSKTEEEKTIRFVLDEETGRRLEAAVAEDEGRDVVPAIATSVPDAIRIRTLEERLEEIGEE